MLEEQSTEGRRNTYRRRQSGVALLFSGILLTILAGAVVVISTVLQQTQREVAQLREQVTTLASGNSPSEASTRDAEALQEWIATLRSEVADSRVAATKAITLAREEGRSDRTNLRKNLARVLHAHGATAEEILSVVETLSPSERARFQTELASMSAPDPNPDEGLTPITPIPPGDVEPTPDPVDPGPTPDTTGTDTGTSDTTEDPPVAVIVDPDEDTTDPGSGDTGSGDTGSGDTGSGDTGSGDTGSGDTGSDTSGSPTEEPAVTTYIIKRGDNLSSIARKLGVTEAALQKANGIRNPNLISVGATLKVPSE